jgi:CheY-like chemotaxis protein
MTDYILIVDDRLPIRFMLQQILWESGYRVQGAASGWECLKIARSEEKPALILLDHHLTGMTGFQVLLELKSDGATREIPVVLISGTENLEELAKSHGAYAVLTKPLDLEVLVKVIHRVLVDCFLKKMQKTGEIK